MEHIVQVVQTDNSDICFIKLVHPLLAIWASIMATIPMSAIPHSHKESKGTTADKQLPNLHSPSV